MHIFHIERGHILEFIKHKATHFLSEPPQVVHSCHLWYSFWKDAPLFVHALDRDTKFAHSDPYLNKYLYMIAQNSPNMEQIIHVCAKWTLCLWSK